MKPSISASRASSTADRQIMLLLFAALLAIYLRMIAPGLLGGDSGEFQFAAWRLGLAHATGYPLYLMIGWLWQHLLALLRVEPATALNVLSSIFAAATSALFYRLLVGWLPGSLLLRRTTALFAALFFGLNPTFWSQALIAEVYTMQALLIVLLMARVKRWGDGAIRPIALSSISNGISTDPSGHNSLPTPRFVADGGLDCTRLVAGWASVDWLWNSVGLTFAALLLYSVAERRFCFALVSSTFGWRDTFTLWYRLARIF